MFHRTALVIFTAVSLAFLGTIARAQETDGRWTAEFIPKVGVVASVNGNVTHGDKFQVAVRGKGCDVGAVYFTAYSYYKKPDFTALQGKTIKVRLNDTLQDADVVSARPFLMGHIAFIDLGAFPLDAVERRFAARKEISAEVLDKDGNSNPLFDIPANSWNVTGLANALGKARQLCKENPVADNSAGATCDTVVTLPAWAAALKRREEDKYLSILKHCTRDRAELQARADALSVSVLGSLDPVAAKLETGREAVSEFVRGTLRVAAEAGFPSAQHNFAAIHNVDPRGPVADLFKVDHDTFLYWTRKAAARKEPRSMFNLAVRLLPQPNAPMPPDPEIAYILLRQIRQEVGDEAKIRSVFGPALDEQLAIAQGVLGPTRVAEADARRGGFDFMSLEPK